MKPPSLPPGKCPTVVVVDDPASLSSDDSEDGHSAGSASEADSGNEGIQGDVRYAFRRYVTRSDGEAEAQVCDVKATADEKARLRASRRRALQIDEAEGERHLVLTRFSPLEGVD